MSKNGGDPIDKNPQITLGKMWRKSREEGYVISLPSGNSAKLRPISLDLLVMHGKIPDMLTPIAAKSLWVETSTEEIGRERDLSAKYIELINLIVPLAMIDPKVVESPQADDEISLEDLDFMDKLAIFNLVTQPADMLRSFRDQQIQRLALTPDGEDIRTQTEPAS
jgi:hypothetical protein